MSSGSNDADSYSSLVTRILNVKGLAGKIKGIVDQKKSYLDLISPDWESRLTDSEIYTTYDSRASKGHSTKQTVDEFRAVLAFECRFDLKTDDYFRIYVTQILKPMSMILRVVTKDLELDHGESVNFFMQSCSPMICRECAEARGVYAAQKCRLASREPCIKWTMLFDGEKVNNRFGSTLKKCFGSTPCLAVAAVRFNSRAVYNRRGDMKRVVSVSGNVDRLLVFSERHLEKDKSVVDIGRIRFGRSTDEEESTEESTDEESNLSFVVSDSCDDDDSSDSDAKYFHEADYLLESDCSSDADYFHEANYLLSDDDSLQDSSFEMEKEDILPRYENDSMQKNKRFKSDDDGEIVEAIPFNSIEKMSETTDESEGLRRSLRIRKR